jgi:hypothetical protein
MPDVMTAPQGYPPETVMTQQQLAAALNVSVDTVIRAGVPAVYRLGKQTPRYIWGDVLAWLKAAA